jgi:hypothetical protein
VSSALGCAHTTATPQPIRQGVNPAAASLDQRRTADPISHVLICRLQREDGTNVNQWHWKEKDCMKWTKARLGELFNSLSLVQGPATVSTAGLESVTGGTRAGLWCVALTRQSSSCGTSTIDPPQIGTPYIASLLPLPLKQCQEQKQGRLTSMLKVIDSNCSRYSSR